MTFKRHGVLVLFSTLFFSQMTFAQYVACPRVGEAIPYLGRNCGSVTVSDAEFQPCVVKDYATILHSAISASIRQECEVERSVRQRRAEWAFAIRDAQMHAMEPPPEPELSPEEYAIMHRLSPSEFPDASEPGGGVEAGPMRQDSCLGDSVETLLRNEANQYCVAPAREIQTVCMRATMAAESGMTAVAENQATAEKILNAKNLSDSDPELTLVEACAHQGVAEEHCANGPMHFTNTQLETLQNHLATIQSANDQCVQSIVQLQDSGCFEIYDRVFRSSEQIEFIKKYCTNEGLNRNVEEFITFMETHQASPVKVLRRLSESHILNREKESNLAQSYDRLARIYELLSNPSGARETASLDHTEVD